MEEIVAEVRHLFLHLSKRKKTELKNFHNQAVTEFTLEFMPGIKPTLPPLT